MAKNGAALASILAVWALFSSTALAANDGVITRLDFNSETSPYGRGITQVSLEGGFDASNCHKGLAGIRKVDSHLLKAALAAFLSGKRVVVTLDPNDRYYQGRCVIRELYMPR